MAKLFADSRKCKMLLYKKLPTILIFAQRVKLSDNVVDQNVINSGNIGRIWFKILIYLFINSGYVPNKLIAFTEISNK